MGSPDTDWCPNLKWTHNCPILTYKQLRVTQTAPPGVLWQSGMYRFVAHCQTAHDIHTAHTPRSPTQPHHRCVSLISLIMWLALVNAWKQRNGRQLRTACTTQGWTHCYKLQQKIVIQWLMLQCLIDTVKDVAERKGRMKEWGESRLKSAINLSRSCHQLQVGFNGVCRFMWV